MGRYYVFRLLVAEAFLLNFLKIILLINIIFRRAVTAVCGTKNVSAVDMDFYGHLRLCIYKNAPMRENRMLTCLDLL